MNDQKSTDLETESEISISKEAAPLRKACRDIKDLKETAAIKTEEISEEHVIVAEIQIPEESSEENLSFPENIKIAKEKAPDSFSEAPKIDEELEEALSDGLTEEKSAEASLQEDLPEEGSTEEALQNAAEAMLAPSFQEDKAEEKPLLSPAAAAFDWFKTFLLSLAAVIFIFTLIFRGVTVNGDSMLPTLHNNEYLIISDLFYTPKTGDIVVVQSPHFKNGTEPLIKRVIATEGQEVTINFSTWKITVDGKELTENYIQKDPYSTMRSEDMIPDEKGEVCFVVEPNSIFVMGDNRNDSLDSRSEAVGQIDERYIMGRVLIRITPFDRFGKVN